MQISQPEREAVTAPRRDQKLWFWSNSYADLTANGTRYVLARGLTTGLSAAEAATLNTHGASLVPLSWDVVDRGLVTIISADCRVETTAGTYVFRAGDPVQGLPPEARNHPSLRSGVGVEGGDIRFLATCSARAAVRADDLSDSEGRDFVEEVEQDYGEQMALRAAPDMPRGVVVADEVTLVDFGVVRRFRAGQRVKKPIEIEALLNARVRLLEVDYNHPDEAA
jgi:hypothetical protein